MAAQRCQLKVKCIRNIGKIIDIFRSPEQHFLDCMGLQILFEQIRVSQVIPGIRKNRVDGDLAGNAHRAGELTADSTAEQASAGLHQCSKVQYEKFQALNDAYKEKFGFPFVMAVRGSSCEEILELFSKRLKNNYEVEFETALAEIHKIARLRLGAVEKDA